MATTRIHDLAVEFGIPSEQLIGILKDMDIFVRSHLSALKDDQVAALEHAEPRRQQEIVEGAAPGEAPQRFGRRHGAQCSPTGADRSGGALARRLVPA